MLTPLAEKPTASDEVTTALWAAFNDPPTPTNREAPVIESCRIEVELSGPVPAWREKETEPAATTRPVPRSTAKSAVTARSLAVSGRVTETPWVDQSIFVPVDAVFAETSKLE